MKNHTRKPKKLFNLEIWHYHEEMIDGVVKAVSRHIETRIWGKGYALCRWAGEQYVKLRTTPRGTFYKIPEHRKKLDCTSPPAACEQVQSGLAPG